MPGVTVGLGTERIRQRDSLMEFSKSLLCWQRLHTPWLIGPLAGAMTQWCWQSSVFELAVFIAASIEPYYYKRGAIPRQLIGSTRLQTA